jgi:hypothetical protein
MIEYENQTFQRLYDRGDALFLENMRFEGCMFESCALSLTKDINRRSTVRNVSLKNCASNGCGIGPAIFEDVDVDGLATNDLLIIWAATFQHVKISGDIGKIKINPWAHFVDRTEATQGPFTTQREILYGSIDWALDISEARFKAFEIEGIPARLIRRDPESQVMITRARAVSDDWLGTARSTNNPWLLSIELFLSDNVKDMVLVAPLGAPKKKRDELLRGLRELRDLGVAEPD